MPRYRIHRDYGFVGTHESYVEEFESEEDASEHAESWAMEQVEYWVELVEDDSGEA